MTDWSASEPAPASNGYPFGCSRLAVARLLLADLGRGSYKDDPVTRWVVAWMATEGRNTMTNNPLNTTMTAPGSKPLPGNSAGVQILPNLDTAVSLYSKNLKTGLYAKLNAALVSGTPADCSAALQASGWCGGPRNPCPGYGAHVGAVAAAYHSDAVYGPQALWPAGTVPLNTITVGPNNRSMVGGDAGQAKPEDPFGLTGFLDAVSTIIHWLMDPANWRRIGEVAGGVLIAGVGIVLIKHDTLGQAVTAVKKTAELAAVA